MEAHRSSPRSRSSVKTNNSRAVYMLHEPRLAFYFFTVSDLSKRIDVGINIRFFRVLGAETHRRV